MNAVANYDEWVLKTLLQLTGNGNVFKNGNDATAHVNYNVLRECYAAGMTQYEAARYYQELERFWDTGEADWEEFMKPREWLAKRKENEMKQENPHVCACGGHCKTKQHKTYHVGDVIFYSFLSGLLGFIIGYTF